MYHPFSIAETIKSAWNIIKKNYISLIVYSIMSLACYWAISFVTSFIFVYDNAYSQVTFVLFMMLIQSYLVLSFYKLILTLMDKEYYDFDFSDIIPSLKMAFNCVLIGLAYTIVIATIIFINLRFKEYETLISILDKLEMVGVGYLLIRSIFCLCFIVDDDSGAAECLKQSFSITRNNVLKIIGMILIVLFFIAVLLLIINGVITVFVDENSPSKDYVFKIAGICWFAISFPFVQVMIMATYRKLVYSHLDVDDDVTETI